MLVVNASFVGGFGAARKVVSFTKALRERNVPYKLITDSAFKGKLEAMGVPYDFIVPWERGDSNQAKYYSVREVMSSVSYDAMVSFGWRTYVPNDATIKGIPCVIVDGGWPEVLQEMPGEFSFEVYRKLEAYCLTTHFYTPEMDGFLPEGIRFEWIAQPFSSEEIDWHLGLKGTRNLLRRQMEARFPELDTTSKIVFLNMHSDYVNSWQLDYVGGFMTARQLDECRGYVTRLLVELDTQDNLLILHRDIAEQVRAVVAGCKRLKVLELTNLDPNTQHHQLRCSADIVFARAIRDVSSAQLALSGQPTLHTICPARDGYMGEWDSVLLAESLGIAKPIAHEDVSLSEVMKEGIDAKITQCAVETAERFSRERGVSYLLDLLGIN